MSESRDDAQTKTRGTLLVVDGHSLAFRAFFALPAENFSTQAGQATNAVWGFATMLSQVLDSEKPDHLAVAFDMKGGTFRNEMLPQYKGTREAAPEDLLTQLPLIQKMLTALGGTYVEKQGYEGDDIIATLAAMGERSERRIRRRSRLRRMCAAMWRALYSASRSPPRVHGRARFTFRGPRRRSSSPMWPACMRRIMR